MGGSSHGHCEEITPCGLAAAKTVVLVGRRGNGKSATGNSIIGRKVFESMQSLVGVTSTCQLETTIFDGQVLNVIDTPGLFDSSTEPQVMDKEIAKCIDMAGDGIHAVIVVLALGSRFSEEEASAFEGLCQIFGGKIADYMIVAFSRGDILGNNTSLDDLMRNSPKILENTLAMCGNRTVVFDNISKDELKKLSQRKELLTLVETIICNNDGKPYTKDLFHQFKKEKNLVDQSIDRKVPYPNAKQFDPFIEKVESRLKESVSFLEKQLAEERAARAEAEERVKVARAITASSERKIEEHLRIAEERRWELQHKLNQQRALCPIL